MKHFIPVFLIAAVLIGAGTYYQGIYAERWQKMDSELLQDFTKHVPTMPKEFGPWVLSEEVEISKEEWKATNCTAYVSRWYLNRNTGERISFYLVSGTAKHITIHTPDWCMMAAGFDQEKPTVEYKFEVEGMEVEAATAVFRKEGDGVRTYWMYSDNGEWQGPAHPSVAKMKYGGRPAMYKIYLTSDPTPDPADNPCNQFAADAFPTINKLLFDTPLKDDEGTSNLAM